MMGFNVIQKETMGSNVIQKEMMASNVIPEKTGDDDLQWFD